MYRIQFFEILCYFRKVYVLEIPIETSVLLLNLYLRIFESYISDFCVNICQMLTPSESY